MPSSPFGDPLQSKPLGEARTLDALKRTDAAPQNKIVSQPQKVAEGRMFQLISC
jgi:hypothetical protein